jgi:hypothetical protein
MVVTSSTWNDRSDVTERKVTEAGADLFRSFGISLNITTDHTIHDRCVVFDHGLLVKLGRGLDFYKPATGLASHRVASRKVRRTDIDVFAIPGFRGVSKLN